MAGDNWIPHRVDFSLNPRTKRKVVLSHLGDLSNILCSHLWIPSYPRQRKAIKDQGKDGGVCHLRKYEIAILKKLFVWSWNMLLMLEIFFPSFISQKPGKILIFVTFLVTFSIFINILLKIHYLEVQSCLWCHCDVIHWMFVLILVCMESQKDLQLYCGSNCKGRVQFSSLGWWYINPFLLQQHF